MYCYNSPKYLYLLSYCNPLSSCEYINLFCPSNLRFPGFLAYTLCLQIFVCVILLLKYDLCHCSQQHHSQEQIHFPLRVNMVYL
jgi:hypothetical protein